MSIVLIYPHEKEIYCGKIRAFSSLMLCSCVKTSISSIQVSVSQWDLNQEWHTTWNSYLTTSHERNAFLVLGNHACHGCDCSNYVDKDSFAIVCLMTLQKLTYYFVPACGKHIYRSSGVLCRTNRVQERKRHHFTVFFAVNFVTTAQPKDDMLDEGYCILWVKQQYNAWVLIK